MTVAESYMLRLGDEHESRWPVDRRRELAWYDPYAVPYFLGNSYHCRHGGCPDTNWGGFDRVHTRGEQCPPEYFGTHRKELVDIFVETTNRCPCHD